jgi:hypothetical protein
MAIVNIENIKSKFEAGDSPRSSDYIDMIDTLASLPEPITGPTGATGTAVYDTDQAVISMQVFG